MIRPATAADALAIARVQVESWEGVYRGLMPDALIGSFTVENRTEQWERFFASPGARTAFVAEHDGVVGMASAGPARGDDVSPTLVGEVYAVYVLPGHWNHGHGRDLMEAATAGLAGQGFSEAILWVLKGNDRARHFYERAGWHLDGHTQVEVLPEGSLEEVRYGRDLGTRPLTVTSF
jgi:GNAT superfamily N-acetyltransferase